MMAALVCVCNSDVITCSARALIMKVLPDVHCNTDDNSVIQTVNRAFSVICYAMWKKRYKLIYYTLFILLLVNKVSCTI